MGAEAGAQGGMWNIAWDCVENTELSLHFSLLWMSLSSADSMGGAVLHVWICSWSTYMCKQRQGSHLWLWPGSSQQVMGESCSALTAHGGYWISKAQANRIRCVRLKDINCCESGRKGSNMIISSLWRPRVSLGYWKLPYNLCLFHCFRSGISQIFTFLP